MCDKKVALKFKMAAIRVLMYESETWDLGKRFSCQSGNNNVDIDRVDKES